MDRLDAMSVFLSVADLGSFSAAGRALRLPLPTVSRKVAELEAHLGVKLFVRTTRRLALTEAGKSYRLAARRILAEVEEAERSAAGEFRAPRGELTLTAPVLFGRLHVLPIVIEFLADYPEIDIRLALTDRNLDVIDEHVDVAVRIGQLPESGLIATRLGAIRRVVCAPPRLIAQFGAPNCRTTCVAGPASSSVPYRLRGPGRFASRRRAGPWRLKSSRGFRSPPRKRRCRRRARASAPFACCIISAPTPSAPARSKFCSRILNPSPRRSISSTCRAGGRR